MILKSGLRFSLREWKLNEMKFVKEYCWAITQPARQSCCGRSASSVLQFGFQLESFV